MNRHSHSRRFEAIANHMLNSQHEEKNTRDRALGKLRSMNMLYPDDVLLRPYADLIKQFETQLRLLNVELHGPLK